jgi:hypothetical protein
MGDMSKSRGTYQGIRISLDISYDGKEVREECADYRLETCKSSTLNKNVKPCIFLWLLLHLFMTILSLTGCPSMDLYGITARAMDPLLQQSAPGTDHMIRCAPGTSRL